MTTTQITADTQFGRFLGEIIAGGGKPDALRIQNVWETGVHDGSGSMGLICSAMRAANESSSRPRVWRYVGWESDQARATEAAARLAEILKADAYARAEIIVACSVKDSPMLRSIGLRPSRAAKELAAELAPVSPFMETGARVARYVAREVEALKVPHDDATPDLAAALYIGESGDLDGAGSSITVTEFVDDDGKPLSVLPAGCTLGEALSATVEFEQTARQDVGIPHPDLILLDSSGLLGYAEFCTLLGFINWPCFVALDDTNHIKHARSVKRIAGDNRFQKRFSTDERFGSGVWAFKPEGWGK